MVSYYPDLLQGDLKAERPDLHIKGFTAVEDPLLLRQKYGLSYRRGDRPSLREAGLGSSMPGGGAEIFACLEPVRSSAHDKVDAEGWLEVHRTAHQTRHALPTARCSMEAIERLEERVDHLVRLRAASGRDRVGSRPSSP